MVEQWSVTKADIIIVVVLFSFILVDSKIMRHNMENRSVHKINEFFSQMRKYYYKTKVTVRLANG